MMRMQIPEPAALEPVIQVTFQTYTIYSAFTEAENGKSHFSSGWFNIVQLCENEGENLLLHLLQPQVHGTGTETLIFTRRF